MGIRTSAALGRLRDIAPYIFDPRVGLFGEVGEHDREAGLPEFFRYLATAGDTTWISGHQNFTIGGGCATIRDIALAKAIGEAVERYSSAIYDRREFPLSTYSNAPFECVPPDAFALYGDSQFGGEDFPYQPLTNDSDVRWVPTQSLVSGRTRHVPASFVYLPYLFPRDGDEWPIAQSISTGLACHTSFDRAALGGICEVIERDCFSITWQAMVSRTRIRLDSLPTEHRSSLQRFVNAGYSAYVVDITHDNGVPTIMTILRGRQPGTAPLSVAAATDLRPEVALRKSIEEMAHTERYVRQILSELARIDAEDDHRNVYSQVSHVNFWTSPQRSHRADFLFASPNEMDFGKIVDRSTGDTKHDLEMVVAQVAQTGHDVLVADITTEDVADQLGFSVVRAIIPGYHPLFMGYSFRALGGERLWSVPQKLGYTGISKSSGDNPMPHPFP